MDISFITDARLTYFLAAHGTRIRALRESLEISQARMKRLAGIKSGGSSIEFGLVKHNAKQYLAAILVAAARLNRGDFIREFCTLADRAIADAEIQTSEFVRSVDLRFDEIVPPERARVETATDRMLNRLESDLGGAQ